MLIKNSVYVKYLLIFFSLAMDRCTSSFYKLEEKLFKYKWSFPYWAPSQQTLESTLKKKFTFDTVISSETELKWEVGFEQHPIWPTSCVLFYWKIKHRMNLSGLHPKSYNLDANISIDLLSGNTEITKSAHAKINSDTDTKWCICNEGSLGAGIDLLDDSLSAHLNPKGQITFVISVSVRLQPQKMLPQNGPIFTPTFQEHVSNFLGNWEKIQSDVSLMDIIIFTKDKQRIQAHKLVIRAQCPQFAMLYPAQFSKPGSVIVNVEEFSLKTIEILVHYFYSGKLLKCWQDNDVLAEFCTAVDHYQINGLLRTLDQYLGSVNNIHNFADAWELLKLARKLGLSNAEGRLKDIIMSTAKSATSPDELMAFMCGPSTRNTSSTNKIVY